jgi:uncharacterized protein (TIGR00661 family)
MGIQATGQGHLTRSIDLYNMLVSNPAVSQIDVLISGTKSVPRGLPFAVKYHYRGFSFSYGRRGNISLLKTIPRLNLMSFWHGVLFTPFEQYDLILSDYEPISVWGARLRGIDTVGLGNMFSMTSKNFPNSNVSSRLSKLATNILCPVHHKVANHYRKFDDFVFAPVIRSEIRAAAPTDTGSILVYLTSYSEEELVVFFGHDYFTKNQFIIYTASPTCTALPPNINVKPLNQGSFTQDMIASKAVITAGGFQTTAEALYLGKKLLCIPMKKQAEQLSNAKALEEIGIKILTQLDHYEIKIWLQHAVAIQIKFADEMPAMVSRILAAA